MVTNHEEGGLQNERGGGKRSFTHTKRGGGVRKRFEVVFETGA